MARYVGRALQPGLGQSLRLLGLPTYEVPVECHRAAELLSVVVGQLTGRPVEDGKQRSGVRTHDGIHLAVSQRGPQGVRIDCAPRDVASIRLDVDAGLGQPDREVGEGG